MKPCEIGKAYDRITDRWECNTFNRLNGIEAHNKAIAFVQAKGKALDVGCGCNGRIIDLLLDNDFTPEGMDVSEKMLTIAKTRHPGVRFYQQDICSWQGTEQYDFISAWDSIWHVPLEQQEQVLSKLVASLHPNGVLIFSFGGTDKKDEHNNSAMGPALYYSSLGINGFITLLIKLGCICRHLEYDQYPELHAYLIVQKAIM
ncbi:MAG: class I SAM-dependent methyltransferase [Paraglaciecola sp.]|uniref:class I SAM-dependent methyltransferase n=1 Tax=Paraglaciecola sp. TaxID=1920173 RepID=UPI00273F3322|nr:class I SAM-dependent methyltransferase [Paraglaciecola sp.]MDP5032118.1 class I SAM-dependent methyltransferase [Paraglaciecola sp.]MDP5131814.1 class I SAM-dependent methyltransferase [Paraglaciecola sp.]